MAREDMRLTTGNLSGAGILGDAVLDLLWLKRSYNVNAWCLFGFATSSYSSAN